MDPQQKQKILLYTAVGFASVIFVGFAYYLVRDDMTQTPTMPEKIKMDLPGKKLNRQEIWMNQMESEAKLQGKKIDFIENIVTHPHKQESNNQDVEALKQEIENLKGMMQGMLQQQSIQNPEETQPSTSIKKYALKLNFNKGSVKDIIPAGGFCKAIIMSAVDSSVGVSVSADPQPVMMRILDQGKLPNNFSSRLKRCVIIGSSKGDLSSERVYIRLEKLSCVDIKTKEVIETDVSGYVVGEDGKNGMRGSVKDRSGSMLGNAMFSGFLSGTSQFLQSAIQARSLTRLTNQESGAGIQNNVLSADLFKSGGTQGVTNAFDKLADYYIKRAEQLQPVVQVAAGRIVNIVFTKSARIGTKSMVKQS